MQGLVAVIPAAVRAAKKVRISMRYAGWSTGEEGGVSLLVAADGDDVLADSIKSGSFKVGLAVVGKSFFVESSLEILQSQSVVEDNAVVDSLTFDHR